MRLVYDMQWFLQEGGRDLWRGRVMAGLSLTTMGAALFVLGIFLFLNHNISLVLRGWEDDPDVSVFLEDDLEEEQVRDLGRLLGAHPAVDAYEYLSREEAIRLFEEAFPAARGLAGEEGLPASLEVRLVEGVERRTVDQLLETLALRPEVEEVYWDAQIRASLDRYVGWLRLGSLALGLLLLSAACAIIFNGVRMRYLARAGEVEILKVIGATRPFLMGPYLIEGALLGLGAGLLAVAALVALEGYILANLPEADPLVFPLHPGFLPPLKTLGLVALGVVMGLVGSVFSLLRPAARV